MKSLRMMMLSVMILSILGSLGTNAQLLTTTEKIPLGELSKSIKCTHHTEWCLTSLPPVSFYQFSLRNKKGICVHLPSYSYGNGRGEEKKTFEKNKKCKQFEEEEGMINKYLRAVVWRRGKKLNFKVLYKLLKLTCSLWKSTW